MTMTYLAVDATTVQWLTSGYALVGAFMLCVGATISFKSATKKAQAHPGGIVDLAVGTPVDPVSPGVQLALTAAAQNSGYPQTAGTPELREAIAAALTRRYNMQVDRVLPVVGTKKQAQESIATQADRCGMPYVKSRILRWNLLSLRGFCLFS